ncbi:MAG: TlpA family protein disulfide reductase [Phycisphaerales bacterium]|nr:TlpA family protein disulfide reductase [Phycisphaerales bacterium]
MMTRVLTVSVVATLAGIVLATTQAPAQAPTTGGEKQAAAVQTPPATKAALEKSLAAYKALTSYRDKQLAKFETKFKPGTEPNIPKMLDQESTLAWGAPNRLALSSPVVSIHSDGKLFTCSIPTLGQYTQEAVPATFDSDEPMEPERATAAVWLGQHDIASLLMRRPTDAGSLMRNVESWGEARPDTIDGEAGLRIAGTLKNESLTGMDEPARFTVFISNATGLIRELRRDMTPMYREAIEGYAEDSPEDKKPVLERAEWVFAFTDVKTNEPIADSEFEFKPAEGAKKVEKFEMNGGGEGGPDPQMAMIGKPAPAIKAKMLDGTAFDLASLKGKIVLLDFWATWCGPCVQAIPKVQKVAEKFADKGVVVLGINGDEGDTKKVTSFLEKKKISIRQVMDTDGSIGRDYGVTGIPCMVMLDAQGVVQDIHVGAGPSIESELTEQVEKMLKGQALHTPEEIAAFQKGAEGAAEGAVGASAAAPQTGAAPEALRPLNAEKLASGKRLTIGGGWGAFSRDIDGDGKQELLAPDAQGGVSIISADGSAARTVHFRGAGRFSVTSAAPATLAGRTGWVVTGSRFSDEPGQGVVIGFFGEDGTAVWQHTPEFGSGTSVQAWIDAADLDGDGSTEVVVLATAYETSAAGPGERANAQPRTTLTILDASGAVVSRRTAGEFASGMWIAAPASPGGARAVVVTGAAGAETYVFTPKAAAAGDASK